MTHAPQLHHMAPCSVAPKQEHHSDEGTRSEVSFVRSLTIVRLAGLSVLLLMVSEASAQEVIRFNHLQDGDMTYTREVEDGDTITVVVEQTCKQGFRYDIRGTEGEELSRGGRSSPPLADTTLNIPHNKEYGGYIVNIIPRNDSSALQCVGGEGLQDRTIVIVTPSPVWRLALSGGFTGRALRDNKYGSRASAEDPNTRIIVKDDEARDIADLGLASFAHIYHTRLPWLAGVFGIGIETNTNTSYYIGGGYRFGDKMSLFGGGVLGAISRLPVGMKENDPIVNESILNDLPKKVGVGWFIGLSYSFIEADDFGRKPMAGSSPN